MCQQASQESHWLCASVPDIGCQQTTLRQHTVPTRITSNHPIVARPPCSQRHIRFAHLILKKSFITEVKLSSATVEDFCFYCCTKHHVAHYPEWPPNHTTTSWAIQRSNFSAMVHPNQFIYYSVFTIKLQIRHTEDFSDVSAQIAVILYTGLL